MTHRGRSTFFALSLLFVIAGCIYGENVLVYDAHQGIIRDDTGIGIVSLSIYEVTESGAKKRLICEFTLDEKTDAQSEIHLRGPNPDYVVTCTDSTRIGHRYQAVSSHMDSRSSLEFTPLWRGSSPDLWRGS